MGFDSSIRKRVREIARTEEGKLTEEEIYSSPELKSYFEKLHSTMLGAANKRSSSVFLQKDDPRGTVACTDGNTIYINWNSEIVQYYPTPEQRFIAVSGLFFHETAHCLFLDFNEEKRAMEYLSKGKFYGSVPSRLTDEEKSTWNEMKAALDNETVRPVFVQVFHELANIVNDTHDENAIIDEYGSFAGEGISLCAGSMHAGSGMFEEMYAKTVTGKLTDLHVAYNLLLQYTRYGFILCRDQDSLDKSTFGEMLRRIANHANIACVTDDVQRRFTELNYMILVLWPFIKAEIQNQQNQNNGSSQGSSGNSNNQNQQNQQGQGNQSGQQQSGGSGQNNGTPNGQQPGQSGSQNSSGQSDGSFGNVPKEVIEKILKDLNKAAQKAGQTAAPKNRNSSSEAISRRAAERKGEKKDGSGDSIGNDQKAKDQSAQAIYRALDGIRQQIAERKAEQTIEKEAKSEMVDAVLTVNQTSPHVGIPLVLRRDLSVSESDKRKYKSAMKDLAAISKRLQRQIIDALRDLKEGFVSRHKLAGKILVVNDAYRPDGRCFANKKIPQDLPDMALSVLVDHSGSMRGERIETAMKASMLLYDFATGIDIPVSVAGHRKNGDSVEYIVYTDFENVSGNDRYRLSKMSAGGCNRDGMALNIAAGLLEKRPEQVKLLIIISDGRPNDSNYSGDAAAKDIQEIVRNCKRKGIEVIAAAIGNDKANIRAIYKEDFLDITDLSKLPRIMTNIVKKRVLRNAF